MQQLNKRMGKRNRFITTAYEIYKTPLLGILIVKGGMDSPVGLDNISLYKACLKHQVAGESNGKCHNFVNLCPINGFAA